MTVCINGTCPFEDCSHHPGQLKGMPRDDTVTVMSLDAVCRWMSTTGGWRTEYFRGRWSLRII